jgi:hypothetical protein
MNALTASKPAEERDAKFATLFASIVLADQKQTTVLQLLQPDRAQIVQNRRKAKPSGVVNVVDVVASPAR